MNRNMKISLFWSVLCALCLLCALAAAEGCSLCGGDTVCDTCGGLGYQEMQAFDSDALLKVACTGTNCADGRCTACSEAQAEENTADAPQGYHTFIEPKVEEAVREVLGKAEGEISYAELLTITRLEVPSAGIKDLSDLQTMKNLEYVNVPRNQITDLSPLSGLTKMKSLYVGSNQISDLTPVADMVHLEAANLSYNPISDLSALAGLSKFRCLMISSGEISDVTPLAGLTSLTTLDLTNNQISDITPLAGLTSLTSLVLSSNQINDLTPLAGLTALTELDVSLNYISDFSPVEGLAIESLTRGIQQKPKPVAQEKSCAHCGGDGQCDTCGGKGWFYATEGDASSGHKLCDPQYCSGGKCILCADGSKTN